METQPLAPRAAAASAARIAGRETFKGFFGLSAGTLELAASAGGGAGAPAGPSPLSRLGSLRPVAAVAGVVRSSPTAMSVASRLAAPARILPRLFGPASLAIGVVGVGASWHGEGGVGPGTRRAAASAVGGMAGAVGGAMLGAAAGTFVRLPLVGSGAAVGAIAGSIGLGIATAFAGRAAVGAFD